MLVKTRVETFLQDNESCYNLLQVVDGAGLDRHDQEDVSNVHIALNELHNAKRVKHMIPLPNRNVGKNVKNRKKYIPGEIFHFHTMHENLLRKKNQ